VRPLSAEAPAMNPATGFFLDVSTGFFLGIAADFAEHDDRIRARARDHITVISTAQKATVLLGRLT
jgi:hypothetical protein